MSNKTLYYIGAGLLSVGVSVMCFASEREGEQHGRDSVIWTEADKSIKVTDGASARESE